MTTILERHNTGISNELLEQIVAMMLEHLDPKRIVVYGSSARGDYKKTSDIDIAVECYNDNDDTGILSEILNEDLPTLLKLEVINLHKVNEKLRNEILQECLVIYEKA